jgi:hypothetical protein
MPAPSKNYHEATPPRNALNAASQNNPVNIAFCSSHNNPVNISVSTSSFFSVKKLHESLISGSPRSNQISTRQSVEETRSRHTSVSVEISAGRQEESRSKKSSKKSKKL